jgi:hypothetical protein
VPLPYGNSIRSIEIPGRPTLRKTIGIPPIKIGLPLLLRGAPIAMSILYFMGCAIATWLAMLAATKWVSAEISQITFQIFMSLFLGMFSVIYFWRTMMFLQSPLTGPELIIAGDGFIDRRTSTEVRWDEVESIEFLHGGHYAHSVTTAVLTLRRPVTSWRREWLIPLMSTRLRPDNEIGVFISGLGYPDWKIQELLRALVARHAPK